jgi:CRISPR-associated endoribonuclease Cas6
MPNSSRYEMEYHKDVQGLIYGLLRGSQYDNHDKQGYKFFTFSNVFPFHDLRKNDVRNLMISSPNHDFISYIKEQLEYLQDLRIGAMNFKIDY